MKQTRLHAGVGFQLQRVVIRPGNSNARWNPHNIGGPIRLALRACGFVFGGVPIVGDLPSRIIQWNAGVVTFGWSDHPVTPILGHYRHPLPGKIDGGRSFRIRRGRRSRGRALQEKDE